jgi:hypothetical protein
LRKRKRGKGEKRKEGIEEKSNRKIRTDEIYKNIGTYFKQMRKEEMRNIRRGTNEKEDYMITQTIKKKKRGKEGK